jgi:Na+/H+ antiporter NhaC
MESMIGAAVIKIIAMSFGSSTEAGGCFIDNLFNHWSV